MWFTILTSLIYICFAILIGINMVGVIRLNYRKDFSRESDYPYKQLIKKKIKAVILLFILLILVMIFIFLLQNIFSFT